MGAPDPETTLPAAKTGREPFADRDLYHLNSKHAITGRNRNVRDRE